MLESQSVKELQKIIKSRQISIKEVVEYYLDRIEKLNPDLNAIVLQKDRELIIKEAIEKDKAKEIDKSLNGLPIAIKDLTYVVGFKTTYGFPGSKNNQQFKKNSKLFDYIFHICNCINPYKQIQLISEEHVLTLDMQLIV